MKDKHVIEIINKIITLRIHRIKGEYFFIVLSIKGFVVLKYEHIKSMSIIILICFNKLFMKQKSS